MKRSELEKTILGFMVDNGFEEIGEDAASDLVLILDEEYSLIDEEDEPDEEEE